MSYVPPESVVLDFQKQRSLIWQISVGFRRAYRSNSMRFRRQHGALECFSGGSQMVSWDFHGIFRYYLGSLKPSATPSSPLRRDIGSVGINLKILPRHDLKFQESFNGDPWHPYTERSFAVMTSTKMFLNLPWQNMIIDPPTLLVCVLFLLTSTGSIAEW